MYSDSRGFRMIVNAGELSEYSMPAEWHAHEQCWMLAPYRHDYWRMKAIPAQRAFLHVACAISRYEQVCMGVHPSIWDSLRNLYEKEFSYLIEGNAQFHDILFFICDYNDSWMRDVGPTFLLPPRRAIEEARRVVQSNKEHVVGMDWQFNAWGGIYDDWSADDTVARQVVERINTTRLCAPSLPTNTSLPPYPAVNRIRTDGFVLEGGSFHVDGEGTVLTTEECLLHRNRNPHLSKQQIEERLKSYLGATVVIWLPFGLAYDDDTNGHVDNFCCFSRPGQVLLAWPWSPTSGCTSGTTTTSRTTTSTTTTTSRTSSSSSGTSSSSSSSSIGASSSSSSSSSDDDPDMLMRCQAALQVLQSTPDAKGRMLDVVKLPLPPPMYYTDSECDGLAASASASTSTATGSAATGTISVVDEGDKTRTAQSRLAASYVNFYFTNKNALIVPQFFPSLPSPPPPTPVIEGTAADPLSSSSMLIATTAVDPGIEIEKKAPAEASLKAEQGAEDDQDEGRAADALAIATLQAVFPERVIVGIQCSREILLGGGNIHCITQQQPAFFY